MTYAEFLSMYDDFVASYNSGTFEPDVTGWPSVQAEVMCDTPGCLVENQVFLLDLSFNLDGVFRVVCGRCSTEVHNVMGIFSDGNRPLNTTVPQGGGSD